jgi:hypothetical protein
MGEKHVYVDVGHLSMLGEAREHAVEDQRDVDDGWGYATTRPRLTTW